MTKFLKLNKFEAIILCVWLLILYDDLAFWSNEYTVYRRACFSYENYECVEKWRYAKSLFKAYDKLNIVKEKTSNGSVIEYDNCKVFDKKNWECRIGIDQSSYIALSNGQYSYLNDTPKTVYQDTNFLIYYFNYFI